MKLLQNMILISVLFNSCIREDDLGIEISFQVFENNTSYDIIMVSYDEKESVIDTLYSQIDD